MPKFKKDMDSKLGYKYKMKKDGYGMKKMKMPKTELEAKVKDVPLK